jgi:DNA modification methylase
MDISKTDTLNVAAGREDKDERHICPLQLQAIARCLELWTNEGDTVLSPFAGIGSEGYEAIRNKRKFIGVELKPSYYQTMLNNLKRAKRTSRGLLI